MVDATALAPDPLSDITAMVLAGGEGKRMGGLDKAWVDWQGQALITHVLTRLQHQYHSPEHPFHTIAMNANRQIERYADLGFPVWPDAAGIGGIGPLAGVLTGLRQCKTPWLLTLACDAPRIPLTLASRLRQAATQNKADIAVAYGRDAPDNALRIQPMFCLIAQHLHPHLLQYLNSGERKIETWIVQNAHIAVPFDTPEDASAFLNLNTPEDLQQRHG